MLFSQLKILSLTFFEGVKLFADADVFNVICVALNQAPDSNSTVNRFWFKQSFEIANQDQVLQQEKGDRVFRNDENIINLNNTILLDKIVYINKGMVLNCHEKKYPNQFVKDDLIVDQKDQQHPVAYIEGKDLNDYQVNRIRYLEYGANLRCPQKVSRPTFPELYQDQHIVVGKTGGITIVDGKIYSNDSVRILLPWYKLNKVQNRSINREKVEENKEISKQYSLQYLVALLCSNTIKKFLSSISTGTRGDIFPDDLRKIPIKQLTKTEQKPYITKVNKLIKLNWQIYEYNQQGHEIKFNYNLDNELTINVDFLVIFNQLNLECWDFIDAEDQRFEIVGDRNLPLTKIKVKDNYILNGKDQLIYTENNLVLTFLIQYLPQFEKRGLNYLSLLNMAKIPKTDEDLNRLFQECDRLEQEIKNTIKNIRQSYQELNEMVENLYSTGSIV